MNILYFHEKELWSPSLNDMLEDIENMTEFVSVSKEQIEQGKQMQLWIAPFDNP